MSRHPLLLRALSILIGLTIPLLLAEGVLRLLPVWSALASQPVTAADPVLHFAPHRDFIYSSDWKFSIVNRGRTNNFGFINPQDYDSASGPPLLAIVGDSYIEALMLPFEETLQGRLARIVGPGGRVYSFGVSGGPLSQYLAEAEFAHQKFHPDGLTIVVVGNDFDESLLRYKSAPGFHYFAETTQGLQLTRVDYHPSLGRRLIRSFALSRYLFGNLKLGESLASLIATFHGDSAKVTDFAGNTRFRADSERVAASRRAVDQFLIEVPRRSGLPASRIQFLLDGVRPELYSDDGLRRAEASYFGQMRRYFIARAGAAGFEVIDLQPRFVEKFHREGVRFEFSTDAHWNASGHAEAAAAVVQSEVFRHLFPALAGTH